MKMTTIDCHRAVDEIETNTLIPIHSQAKPKVRISNDFCKPNNMDANASACKRRWEKRIKIAFPQKLKNISIRSSINCNCCTYKNSGWNLVYEQQLQHSMSKSSSSSNTANANIWFVFEHIIAAAATTTTTKYALAHKNGVCSEFSQQQILIFDGSFIAERIIFACKHVYTLHYLYDNLFIILDFNISIARMSEENDFLYFEIA